MWRGDEVDPFQTEVGYWLWDAAAGSVMRGFVVPRGIAVLAGGTAGVDDVSFTMSATRGDPNWGVSENLSLRDNASTLRCSVSITIDGPDTWSDVEETTLAMQEIEGEFPHTDGNTLHRTG